MKWNGHIISTVQPRESVNDFGDTLAINFLSGDLILENGDMKSVSGYDAFVETFRNTLLSSKTPLFNFGLANFLPNANDQTEFDQQCENLAYEIVSEPTALGSTVEEIFSISREIILETETLTFELKVTGKDEIVTIVIPYPDGLKHGQ